MDLDFYQNGGDDLIPNDPQLYGNFVTADSLERWMPGGPNNANNSDQSVGSLFRRHVVEGGNVSLQDGSEINHPDAATYSVTPNQDFPHIASGRTGYLGVNREDVTGGCQPTQYRRYPQSCDAGPSEDSNLPFQDGPSSTWPPQSVSPYNTLGLHPELCIENVEKRLHPQEEALLVAKGPWALDHPEIRKLLKTVKNIPHLHGLINYIVTSEWYQMGGPECLPGKELRKFVPIRKRSKSSKNSPFGAFFSQTRPYICFLCPQDDDPPQRTCERALGHARKHFDFKLNGYYDRNTEKDVTCRGGKPPKTCRRCNMSITSQNWSRHVKSKAHKVAPNQP